MVSHQVATKVIPGVLVARKHVVRVAIDLHVSVDGHICGRDERVVLINILVLAALKEGAGDDA